MGKIAKTYNLDDETIACIETHAKELGIDNMSFVARKLIKQGFKCRTILVPLVSGDGQTIREAFLQNPNILESEGME